MSEIAKIPFPVLKSDLYGNILQYLDLVDARNFTTVSNDVLSQNYNYLGTMEPIIGKLEFWRKRFPNAIYANIYRGSIAFKDHKDVREFTDEDFKYLEGIKKLNMKGCNRITDIAFVHLKGIQYLNIDSTDITGDGFVHLEGIKELDISSQ